MTNSLGQMLTAMLQQKGIERDNYDAISRAVYRSLLCITKQMELGQEFEMPNGDTFKKVFSLD